MEKVTAFLPCRSGSQRVINKNTRPFAGNSNGLIGIKLDQLLQSELIEKVVLSTDDDKVKEIGRSFNNGKIIIDDRPAALAMSSTSTDEVIEYVAGIIDNKHILWTHVTSPFVGTEIYNNAIQLYFEKKHEYDSLMSVTPLKKFAWFKGSPVNYNREIEKWPRTQTLEPIMEVNSAMFIAHSDIYKKHNDRIGLKPNLFEMSVEESFDIDWEIDFKIAEMIWENEKK